jgi:hypothetical protein
MNYGTSFVVFSELQSMSVSREIFPAFEVLMHFSTSHKGRAAVTMEAWRCRN